MGPVISAKSRLVKYYNLSRNMETFGNQQEIPPEQSDIYTKWYFVYFGRVFRVLNNALKGIWSGKYTILPWIRPGSQVFWGMFGLVMSRTQSLTEIFSPNGTKNCVLVMESCPFLGLHPGLVKSLCFCLRSRDQLSLIVAGMLLVDIGVCLDF